METGTVTNGSGKPHPQKGVGSGRYVRTPAMLAKMRAKRRRNAREATGKEIAPRKGGRKERKSAPPTAHGKPAGTARRGGPVDALVYLGIAAERALTLAAGGIPQAARILGLIELAREALGED